MQKKCIKLYLIIGILFTVISIVAFFVPTQKTSTFWVAYVFTSIAFVVQIGIWTNTIARDNTLKSKFFGFPIIYISVIYAFLQIISMSVFVVMPTLPVWSAIVVCSIIAGISWICMITVDAGRNEIERVETNVQKKIFYIRGLQVEIELLASSEKDITVKTALIQLAEKIRFSDPMSNNQVEDLENKITTRVAELKISSNKAEIVRELAALLDERNKKCKALK